MYFCVGEEMLADEVLAVARKCAQASEAGVTLEHFEAMPHCFSMLLVGTKASDRCFAGQADFCKSVVEKGVAKTHGVWITAPSLAEETIDVLKVKETMSDDDIARRMTREMDSRIKVWEEAVRDAKAKM